KCGAHRHRSRAPDGCGACGRCATRRRIPGEPDRPIRSGWWSCDTDLELEDFRVELRQIIVGEIAPAVAGVVFALLDVAGDGETVHFLARQLPLVSQLFELFTGHGA